MKLIENRKFKYNFYRHGNREWVVFVGNATLITNNVLCIGVTQTILDRHGRAYITGKGTIYYTKELTTIVC